MSVDQTPLPSYINRMLEVLVEEEQDCEADGLNGAVGPCMEYLLQHRILDTMYTFARTDVCIRFSSFCVIVCAMWSLRQHSRISVHVRYLLNARLGGWSC